MKKRCSGVLMPISSLPSPYGIGTLGNIAYDWIDFLRESGQSWWQILPLGPTSYGDSPYQSFSSAAGNPYLIDLDMLVCEGLLEKNDLSGINWGENPERVDYGLIFNSRFKVLYKAYQKGKETLKGEFEAFRLENREWVETTLSLCR